MRRHLHGGEAKHVFRAQRVCVLHLQLQPGSNCNVVLCAERGTPNTDLTTRGSIRQMELSISLYLHEFPLKLLVKHSPMACGIKGTNERKSSVGATRVRGRVQRSGAPGPEP